MGEDGLKVLLGVIAVVGILCLCLAFDSCTRVTGVVVEKHYQPAQWVYGVDGKGRLTTHYISPVYTLLVDEGKDAQTVSVDATTYAHAKTGDRIHPSSGYFGYSVEHDNAEVEK